MSIEELLDELVEQVYPQLRERFGAGNCILASKAAVEYLRRHNVPAVAMVSEMNVMNNKWFEAVQAEGANEASMLAAVADGAHCVAAIEDQPDSERKGYKGHVVVVVNREYFVDLTVDQTNRPDKDIIAEPFWLRIPSVQTTAFLKGRLALTATQLHDGKRTWIRYMMQPRRKDFQDAPDWTMPIFRFSVTEKEKSPG